MKHLNANYNETALGPLFDCVNKTPVVAATRHVKYLVVGNHPVLARPDKSFETFNEAVEYSDQLVKDGFEGVTIREDYACPQSDNSTTGQQLKEKGIREVSEHNENWMGRCLQVAPRYLHHRADFTGEDLRFLCENLAGSPRHHNAWGALISTLIKRKIIVPTGEYRQMKDRSSHARSTPVYKAS
jgi:hypothetical protein